MPNRTAVVLGASGSVGAALMRELLRSGAFSEIVALARRSQPELLDSARAAGVVLREVLVPTMDAASLEAAARAAFDGVSAEVVGLSVLGIGAGTAKLTIDQHRAIDVALNGAFARGLAATGRVRHFALMSAVGANASAKATGSGAAGAPRYNRVKGEAEAAVTASGIAVVSIFRPSMIIGSQHTPKLLELLMPLFALVTPARFKAISAEQIAVAMVETSRQIPTASRVYHYPEMMALNKAAVSR
jgi:uncharacterized protein YbjT (DUF2867 family)